MFVKTLLLALAGAGLTLAQNPPPIFDPSHPVSPNANHPHRHLKDVPPYVLRYAPLVHLYSEEKYWPSDMTTHLMHTMPYLNFTPVDKTERFPTVGNLGKYNKYELGEFVFLQSLEDVQTDPEWLTSNDNVPVVEVNGLGPLDGNDDKRENNRKSTLRKRGDGNKEDQVGGRSPAPAVLLVVEKEDGVVDAFWFYFYSYNLGNTVFNIGFGDHVGDWEHSVVRFKNGEPESMFLSQHAFGQSYHFDAMEKYGERPVIYSGRGTHAMYATPGIQAYVLPFAILHDTTDKGPLWDPTLNLFSYHYTPTGDDEAMESLPATPSPYSPSYLTTDFISSTTFPNDTAIVGDILTPTSLTPNAPTSWFLYSGCWGDKEYPTDDPRQYHAPVVGEKHYVSGPRGPRFKALGRKNVCPRDTCVLKSTVQPRIWIVNAMYDWVVVCVAFLIACGFAATGYWIAKCWMGRERVNAKIEEEEDALDQGEGDALARDREADEHAPLLHGPNAGSG